VLGRAAGDDAACERHAPENHHAVWRSRGRLPTPDPTAEGVDDGQRKLVMGVTDRRRTFEREYWQLCGRQYGGGIALSAPTVHSEADARGLSRLVDEAHSRPEDSNLPPDPIAPARGILLSGITGLFLWITLIAVGYLLLGAGGL